VVRNPQINRRLGNQSARKRFGFRAITEVIAELRRVTWPTREETMRLTIMVLSVAVTIGIFLGIVDIGFSRIFDVVLGN
jgi:preprotein translocase subunit SecE